MMIKHREQSGSYICIQEVCSIWTQWMAWNDDECWNEFIKYSSTPAILTCMQQKLETLMFS